jgi:hypothetical protein
MKYLNILLFILLLLTSSVAWGSNYVMMTVHLRSGSETQFFFTKHPKVEIGKDEIVVTTDSGTMNFDRKAVRIITYDNASSVNAVNAPKNGAGISLSGNVLNVANISVAKIVNLYDAGGRVVREAVVSEGSCQLDLSGLAGGIYLVKVGSDTFKIMKR